MKSHLWRWGPTFGLLGAMACSSGPTGPEARVTIKTSPLALEGIGEAVYSVTVVNAQGQTVWDKELVEHLATARARCATSARATPARAPTPTPSALSVVELDDEDGDALGDADWDKPDPIVQEVDCVENSDVVVRFNLTIVRSANQGFFDIAINFSDIFCSAKLDCEPEFLQNPGKGGKSDLTAVVAFACTAGKDQDTTLYWGDASIVCRDGEKITATYPVHPASGEGNHGPIASTQDPKNFGVYESANYQTVEEFEGLDKCSWVTALGLDLTKLGDNCTFEATATAGDHAFTDPYLHTPTDTVYPLIRWKVPLTGSKRELLCGANALNGPHSGVTTEYTSLDGMQFEAGAACGGKPFFNHLACSGTSAGSELAFVPSADGSVSVTYGGKTYGPFALPDGTTFDTGTGECCVEPCCEETPE
ncbi:MAG: hypothetical protein U1F43_24990 [Myxococcota bacterium]